MSRYPSDDQLLDLFNWSSSGLVITSRYGAEVVAANRATIELLGGDTTRRAEFSTLIGVEGYAELARSGVPVENLVVHFVDPEFSDGFANVGFGTVDGKEYAFWALRPRTSSPTPTDSPSEGPGTGHAWIERVRRPAHGYVAQTEAAVPLIKGLYDHCPVAIHMIAEDGHVAYANWKDIELVGASTHPDTYVGHHIRRIYADQEVVDDFLGRWGEDAPIIDFRADFLNEGDRVPVVIFSTANVVDGALKNTRCLVFADDDPRQERDRVAALDLAF